MKKNHFIFRGYFVIISFTILFFILFFRLYYLQIVKHPQFDRQAKRQHYLTLEPQMERGMILDALGRELAISVEVDSFYAEPKKINNPESIARAIKNIINKDARWLKKQLTRDAYFVWLARKVSPECSQALKDLNLEGIETLKEYRRFYPQGSLASHLLGFVGTDNQGLEGLERYYDDLLSPPSFKYQVKRDALGEKIVLEEEEERLSSPKPYNLVLTIDANIQHLAEKALDEVYQTTQAKGAQLIIMEPRTGEILALANRPTFDPNQFSRYLPSDWRNRAITDCYEPGSSFKVVSAAAALEEKVVNSQDKFFCENGSFRFYHWIIHDHTKEGWLTFRQIIEKSSNIGMTKVSLLLGKRKLYKYLRQFGFGEPTGIDFPGEVKGILRPLNQWTEYSLGAIPYGQEISVSSLQLISAVSAIANGGLMMQPYVVKEIRDKKGGLIKKFNPRIKKRVVSTQVAQTLTEFLEGVVTSGTGKLAQVPGYRLAGKTGTAQKFDSNLGKYSWSKTVVSFVGFAPVENPAIAALVMVDEPKGEAWGGTITAPVFKQVVSKTLSYLQISPSEKDKEKVKPQEASSILEVKNHNQLETNSFSESSQTMPDLKGLTIRETLENLSPLNLEISLHGFGFLYSQRPLAGEKISLGERCVLEFRPQYNTNAINKLDTDSHGFGTD